ncbi:hypothetical protein HDV01_002997 [Terramyces sp. JEL0728]|nr:hypothetical protein HDV01_002997 [Terramyces sp. JEL0728]
MTIKIAALLSSTTLLILCLVDVEILNVFSVLTDNITHKFIRVWTFIICALCIFTSVELVIVLFYEWWPDWIAIWINSGELIWAVFTISYDTIQGYFLLYLVFVKKKTQNIPNITIKMFQTLKKAVLIIAGLLLFDCGTAALYIYITFIDSPNIDLKFALLTAVEVNIGFHGVFLIFVVRNLKEFALIGSKTARPNHLNVQVETAILETLADSNVPTVKGLVH